MIVSRAALRTLIDAKFAYDKTLSLHYDEVLHEVTSRAADTGSLGKADVGALLFWKRLRADTRWVPRLMAMPESEVRDLTGQVVNLARDRSLDTPEAARQARSHLSHLPGFHTGDALASAVIFSAAPDRMAIYDKRAQAALARLGLQLSAKPGRYGRYMRLVEDLRTDIHALAGEMWSARDVDLALYWLGRANLTE